MRRKASVVLLVLVVPTLASCGGNQDRDGTTTASTATATATATPTPTSTPRATSTHEGSSPASDHLSRTALIAQADKICRATTKRIKAQPKPTSLADAEQVTEEAARASDEGLKKLEKLAPPDTIEADYEAFVKRTEMAAEQTHDVAAAVKTHDLNKVAAAAGKQLPLESQVRYLEIRFKECSGEEGFVLLRGGPASLVPPLRGRPR